MKKNRYITFLFLFFATFSLLLTSCDVADKNTATKGQIVVKLTDAPADYDAVFIEVESVKIHTDKNPDDGIAEDGWITISDEKQRIDLLELQNGDVILLGRKELDTGFYHQIRLILGDNNTIVVNGTSHPLKTPSAQQSGLKLNINAEVKAGEIYTLLIDFNAAKSIVERGNGKYNLSPVIRTVTLGKTASIEGAVEPATFETKVSAIADGDTLTTFTEDNGAFKFIGVLPNTYKLKVNPLDESYADTTITEINVELEDELKIGTIRLNQK